MITRDTGVTGRSVPDLTFEQFQAIAQVAPAASITEACYDAVVRHGVSVAFALAIYLQESSFGTAGYAVVNRSPGNCRSNQNGKGMVVDAGQDGRYVRYARWEDGWDDLAWRLVKPGFDYAGAGARTIGQIIQIWAPAKDGNQPEKVYIPNVLKWMNGWLKENNNMEIIDLTANTPGRVFTTRLLPVKEVVLHETSGPHDKNSDGLAAVKAANANTIRWFQGGADTGVSIHYYIGPEKLGAPIYRLCNEDKTAYHAIGDKGFYVNASKDNHMSIGIERFGYPTEPVGPNQRAALLWLVVNIATRRGLTPESIISHASIQSDRTDGRILLEACREAVRNGGTNNVSTEPTNKPFNPNPRNFAVGQGVIEKAAAEKLEVLTNEQYMVPENGQAVGLTKRSMTWATKNGAIYLIIGIQDQDNENKPLPTWTMQAWLQAA